MSFWTDFEGARGPAWRAYVTRPLLYCAPLFAAGAFSELIFAISRRSLGERHFLLHLSFCWLVSIPLSLFAEIVLAKMYLERHTEWQKLATEVRALLRWQQLVPLLVRLFGLSTFWFVVAAIPASLVAILASILMSVTFGFDHPGLKLPPSPHRSYLGFIVPWLALFCVLFSRYSFVVPLSATGRFSAKKAMQFGVKLAKANRTLVILLSLVEVALTFGVGHPLRQLGHGTLAGRFVIGLVVLLEGAVVNTFFGLIKAELAVRFWQTADDLTPAR